MKTWLIINYKNVRNFYKLAHAMKDQMESLMAFEKCQKKLNECRAWLSEKDKEVQVLHQHVVLGENLLEKLHACQKQLR